MQKFPNAYVITGSIASGKSTVVNLLKERGFSVIDADLIAHEQLEICKREIVEAFGEQILHPKIKAEIFFKASQFEGLGQVYFVDIPLFFEKKERYAEFKNVAVIYAPKELLLSRLMSRNGLNLEDAKARVELQMDIEQKKKMAKFVIDNSSDREHLKLDLEKFLKQICAIS